MNPFEQLYSVEQLASFRKVQAALVADPTALDNRGGVVASVTEFTNAAEEAKNGTPKDN